MICILVFLSHGNTLSLQLTRSAYFLHRAANFSSGVAKELRACINRTTSFPAENNIHSKDDKSRLFMFKVTWSTVRQFGVTCNRWPVTSLTFRFPSILSKRLMCQTGITISHFPIPGISLFYRMQKNNFISYWCLLCLLSDSCFKTFNLRHKGVFRNSRPWRWKDMTKRLLQVRKHHTTSWGCKKKAYQKLFLLESWGLHQEKAQFPSDHWDCPLVETPLSRPLHRTAQLQMLQLPPSGKHMPA